MTVIKLANLAVKVSDLDAACRWYRDAGAAVTTPTDWEGARRADVSLGPLQITLFTRAVYEDADTVAAEGFLHAALLVDNLDDELTGHSVLWGPAVVSGSFGVRRIAFVEAPGGVRLEFMEQIENGPP